MNREKIAKIEVQLDKKVEEKPVTLTTRKIVERVISFDAYFQLMMKKSSSIAPHHKAPMRKYAESKGLKEATEKEFNRVFRIY